MTPRSNRWAAAAALMALAVSPLTAPATPAAAQTLPAAAPKNVIIMIGDGMGYNAIDLYSAYATNKTYRQVSGSAGSLTQEPGVASLSFESWPVQTSVSTYSLTTTASQVGYSSAKAWGSVDWIKSNPTDSAAAGTALATGVKTRNGVLGFDGSGRELEDLTQRADALGKATGVVTTVPISHATPAAFAAHDPSRSDLVAITHQYLTDDYLDVVMGAGHPFYDNSHQQLSTGSFSAIGSADWAKLTTGATGFTFIDTAADFDAIAAGTWVPSRVFGVAQVASTLQQSRAGTSTVPYDTARNDVPDLATMSTAALNVLKQNDSAGKGFFTMIEGGAIDWAGHANQSARSIEETADFVKAIDATVTWVEANSSWDDTLLIVTADHETGYLTGPDTSGTTWDPITPAGETIVPDLSWLRRDHTNQLVPLYATGKGAAGLAAAATQSDLVRGSYLDNTAVANLLLKNLWKPSELLAATVTAGSVRTAANKAATIPVRIDKANLTGTVSAKIGTRTVSAGLVSGRASLAIPAGSLAVGSHQVPISYSGSDTYAAATTTASVTVTKAASSTSVKLRKKVRSGTRATFVVTVHASGAPRTGTATVRIGSRSARAVVNSHGKARVSFPRFTRRGKVLVKVTYSGNATLTHSHARKRLRVIR
ncbi:MAG TPA: alkaline phosphatase [Propionicimonas sp.]|nr:alkaline phosphatase [Propionicimonas sp.]